MTPSPIPDDDAQRLRALHALLVLDAPPEARFDRLVAFAADEFDMPMATLSLVDEKRQWDSRPRGFDAADQAILGALRDLAVSELVWRAHDAER